MFFHHVWHNLASEHKDALDVKDGFFTEHTNTSEGVLAKFGINSLDESTHQVDEFVKNGTFLSVLLVFHVPERVTIGESFCLEHLFALIHGFSSLVFMVAEEGLEVEKIKVSLGESFHVSIGGSCNNNFLLDSFNLDNGLLLFLLEDRLKSSGAHVDLSVGSHEGGVGRDFLEPSSTLLVDGGFAETSIEDGLESKGKGSSKDEIGNSDLITADELSSEG